MYEIKILSNEDFDNLPVTATRGSDISNSFGFANPITRKAYVRYVGIPDLQKYLVNHEFEELVADKSAHEDENGIRHKSGFMGFGGRPPSMPAVSIPQAPVRRPAPPPPPRADQISAQPSGFSLQGGGGGRVGSGAPEGGPGEGLGGGSRLAGLGQPTDDLGERIRGFYSGRMAF